MDRFIELLKKKLLQVITVEEEKEFEIILNEDQDLRTIYFQFFSKNRGMNSVDELEAEEAFAVHFVKMQLKNNLLKK
jgi:hypothetical protein